MNQFLNPKLLKSNLFILLLFFILTFPGYKALLQTGMFTSQDGEGHIIRLFEFDSALNDGQFPVRFSKRLNWGLGYPYFNYNYPLTYYFTDLFHRIGLDLVNSYKLVLLLTFPFGGFFTFLWLKKHFDNLSALIGGMFFSFIPYHFLNIYVRGNLAESLAISVIPLTLFLSDRLIEKTNFKTVAYLSLGLSMIILFHNLTALIFLPIIFLYNSVILIKNKNYRKFKFLFLSYIFTIGLCSFFLLPSLLEKNIITIDTVFPRYYLSNFPTFKNLIYSAWGYGASNTGVGQMSLQIGLLHEIIIGMALITTLFIRFKKKYSLFYFFLGLILFSLILMQPISIPIWKLLPVLQYLQFPWRLLSVISLSVAFLVANIIFLSKSSLGKKQIFLIGLLLIIGLFYFNKNHWRVNEYYNPPKYWFNDESLGTTTTVDGEHTPIWLNLDETKKKGRYEVVNGSALVKDLTWKSNYHQFQVMSNGESLVLDRTVYFPGWEIYIDSKKVDNLDQYDKRVEGLIGFMVSDGSHNIETKLQEPLVAKIGDSVSLVSILLLSIIVFPKGLIFNRR